MDFIDIAVISVLVGVGFFFYSRARRGRELEVAQPPPATPLASSTTSQPAEEGQQAEPGVIPGFKFYSLNAMAVATVIGSLFAGAVLISRNYSKLGNSRAAFISIVLGILGVVLLAVVSVLFGEVVDEFAEYLPFVPLIQAIVVQSVAKGLQGNALGLHEQQGGQFYSFWRTIGISLLIAPVAVVMFLTFLFFATPDEPPTDIEVHILAPTVVKEGEQFQIQLLVRNHAVTERALVEIEIENEYLQGIAIVGSDPSFSALEDYFSSVGYTYDLPIPPEQEIKIILQAQGVLQGDYSVEFRVCIDDIYSCLDHRVLTTVE